uniref:Uncharacterized protein n=1 Tax=Plectus sambesii TaxID=2011161 RepID=A0A914VW17_9BILA
MNPILLFLGLLACAATGSPATSDQLRQWILANRNSIPAGAEQAIAAANTDGDLASTILRIFGLGKQVSPEPVEKPTGSNGIKIGERDVCPFDADPLILAGEYKSCNPSSIGDCPVGFLCDQSFALGRSICCQDLRNRPNGVQTTMQTPFNWNNLGRTTAPGFRRWTPLTQQPRRGNPWYIKDRTSATPWNSIYNRVTPVEPVDSTEMPTSTPTTSTSTTTELPSTTASGIVNPWARLWSTTTTAPGVGGILPPGQQLPVNVTVLQAGSVRALSEELYESIASITLVTDGEVRILVDTGASSETERLLQTREEEY